MTNPIPDGLTLTTDTDPPPDLRMELGRRINAFLAETAPFTLKRFTLRLDDAAGELAAGLSGMMSWNWMFIDAVWVRADQRGAGVGRALMALAEARAAAEGCHSVWLDTFQTRGFYEKLGYTAFGTLEDYPGPQTRAFMRKRLTPPAS